MFGLFALYQALCSHHPCSEETQVSERGGTAAGPAWEAGSVHVAATLTSFLFLRVRLSPCLEHP